MKAKKLWLSLLALTLIGALGLFSVTASAADDALCTSTDNCTGTYSNGFCSVCDGFEMPENGGMGYDIYNAGQLYWYADYINNGGTMYARLMADIAVNPDLTAENPRVWTPIGTYETPFGGLFDGSGHTVSGLYLNDPAADYVGLFGVISETADLVGVTVADSSFTGRNFVGGVAAYSKGRVRGVGAYDMTIDANSYGGLLVGYNGGETTDSFAHGTVMSGETMGAVGYNVGTVANVYALEGITPIGGGAQKGATSVRESAFASGELAYLLHENETLIYYWGQTLGADAYPRTSADDAMVYRYIKDGVLCTGDIYGYANVETPDGTLVHDENATSYENGFCTVCGGYEPATQNADGVYVIDNAGKLYWFADKVSNDNEAFGAANAVLTADIVINENVLVDGALSPDTDAVAKFRPWDTTIGYPEYDDYTNTYVGPTYTGTFDGDGHSISGLYFDDSESGQFIALFGYIAEGGKVCDLTLKDTYFSGRDSVAGLAAFHYGTVEGCTVEGVIRVSSDNAGGIVVQNYGTVKNSHNKAAVGGEKDAYFLGGIATKNYGTIEGCHNSAEIGGAGLTQIGGIAQVNNAGGVIRNSYNTGTLTGSNMIGGIVYFNQSSSGNKPYGVIENCCNTGAINADRGFAGIAELNRGVIRSCLSTGKLNDGESSIVYQNSSFYYGGTVENSYYLGTADDNFDGTTAVTAEQLASGEVAYLLNGSTSAGTLAWGQTIGEDAHPVFATEGNTVYKSIACENGTVTYSNDASQTATGKHTLDENGFCTVCGGFEEATLNNNGTPDDEADDYYEIANAGQLYWFADKVNSDHANFGAANAVLTADITVNENVLATVGAADFDPANTALKQWIPIGKANFFYNGIFDGAGHSISGLYVYDTSDHAEIGFIGFLGNNGTVKDLTISDSSFTGRYGSFVGAIVGYMLSSTVEGCFSNAAVSGYHAGGIVGYTADSTVEGCFSNAAVSGTYAGGIVGYQSTNDSVRNCGFIGSVYGTDAAGGIIGWAGNFRHLENCFVSGAVSGVNLVGGIVGVGALPVTNCYYNSELFTEPDHSHGGIGMTAAQFASGEVAYNLGAAFGQTIGTDAIPVFADEDNTVYRYYLADCLCSAPAAYGYTNNAEQKGGTFAHDTNIKYVNGFCPICDAYEAASVVTTDNWASLGLSPSNYEKYLGYHAITNAGQLYWFISNEDAYDAAKGMKAVLTRDIVINEGLLDIYYNLTEGSHRKWKPIDGAFAATLDGNGHTVSGLYIDQPKMEYVALISQTASSSVIRDLGIVDSYICGKNYVGAIVGENRGTVENCYNEGRVYGESYISGLVAVNGGTVKNSYNLGLVDAWNITQAAAGIVGYNQATATVEDCYNYSVMSNVGSGIAYVNEGKIINCYYMEGALPSTDYSEGSTDEHAMADYQFANGEVAFRLGAPFGQSINTQSYPVIGGLKVYANVSCIDGAVLETSNDYRPEFESGDHKFGENGLCTVCGAYRPATLNDDGVYKIGNIGQLYWFADKVNNDHANFGAANAVLTADITVNENVLATVGAADFDPTTTALKPWTPIGDSRNRYVGTFDGQGFTVSGLYYYDTNVYHVGLFGLVSGGMVKNVGVTDSYFRGKGRVGSVVGRLEDSLEGTAGTVRNCYSIGNAVHGEACIGGVIGELVYPATVENCYNTGEVSCTNRFAGGVVGGSTGHIKNCFNQGSVSGMDRGVGSVVGSFDDYSGGTLENCYYLSGCAKDGNGTVQNGIGASNVGQSEADEEGSTMAVTAEQLASGEVAYLLNGSTSEGTLAWGQTLDGEDKDSHPVLGGAKVYQTTNCAQTICYSNKATPIISHVYVNGFCTLCDGFEAATQNADGAYEIDNAGKLYWFADKVNSDYENFGAANAVLTADIVINENVLVDGALNPDADVVAKFRQWKTTIGSDALNVFAGTFDGDGHSISGLYFDDSENGRYIALFGYIGEDGKVCDLTLKDTYFSGVSTVAGLAEMNHGTVEGCTVEGVIRVGRTIAGGIVTLNSGTIKNSHNKATVGGEENAQYLGGITVENYGTIEGCHNSAEIGGAGLSKIGGIAQINAPGGVIRNSYNTGTLTGSSQIGGIVSHNYSSNGNLHCGLIENCYNTGAINADRDFAGIADTNWGEIRNCFSTGKINDGESSIARLNDNADSKIENSYYLGTADDSLDGTTAVTVEQLASGEVAYLLQGEQTEEVWGQTVGEDVLPTLGGKKVYKNTDGCDPNAAGTVKYGNIPSAPEGHLYVNGICTVCGAYQPATLNDDGVYEIGNIGQLYWFADKVNSDNANFGAANAVLTADIVINENVLIDGALSPDTDAVAKFRPWDTTIGYPEYDDYTNTYVGPAYTGTFDGDGHSISGLYFDDSESGQFIALFGYIAEGGKVCDLTLKDTYFSGRDFVAGLAAFNYGTVEGCTVEGVIRVGQSMAGGIVVQNYGTVKNSRNKATVFGEENAYFLGGIAVFNYATIDGCHNSAAIGGAGLPQIGGIAYINESGGVIRNSHNSGTLTGKYMIGGIVSHNQSSYDNKPCGLIENCYNTGAINADRDFAGVADINWGEIRNCFSTGKINDGESSIARLNNNADSKIENSYYLGTADDSLDGTTAVTAEQFASGEVAYLLQGEQTEPVWGQTPDGEEKDSYPVLGGAKVYRSTPCPNTTLYTNTEGITSSARCAYENGFCKFCDGFEAPTLNNNNTPDNAADDYYEIDNAGKLYWFADKVSNDNEAFGAANAKLTADIVINENVLIDGALNPDADAVAKFRPWETTIGYSVYGSSPGDIVKYPYTGTFDGDGHSISGLYFDDSETGQRIALFGRIGEDGKVSDLTLKDTYFSGYIDVAGLAAHNFGTVEGCTVEGVIRVSVCSTGGIVAQNYGTVKNSRNKATVGSEKDAYFLGGIAAYNYGTIDGCHNSAEIGGAGLTQIGGIAQINAPGGVIRNSYNTGTLTGSSVIGGIVSHNNSSNGNMRCGVIENCYNTGAINANRNFAGIAYTNWGMIRNCFSTGKINDGESSIAYINNHEDSEFVNSYYLGMSENDGFEGTFALTAEQFASGEAAHRLQSAIAADENGEIPHIWGQAIGEDAHPTLGGDEVYAYTTGKCSAPETKFANVETESTVVHDDQASIRYTEDENGDMICIVCHKKAVFAANVDYDYQTFFFTTPAGVTAWVNDRDMGVTTVTLLSDITEDVQFDRNVTVELGGNTLSGRLIVGEGSSVTLRNGVVEADIWNRNELILGENVRVTGDIKECGNLYIASPLMTAIDVAGEGTIRGYNNYRLTTTDLESIRIALAEGEAKVLIDPEGIGEIRFGKLEITLSPDEFFYERDTQAIPEVIVSIGGYVLGSGSCTVEWPTDMIYPGIKTVKVTLPDTVITESGEREFELTYEIKKAIPVAGTTTVALPYGADLTEGVVRGAVRHSAENLVHVGGSWSAVTLGSDGKYYATFTPSGIDGGRDYGDLYEAITVEITDDMRDETQVTLEEVTVHGPAWVVLGENMTFSVTAKNPENGETFPIPKEHVQYFYKIGEDGNWIACAALGEDTFSLNVSAGDKVYIKAEIVPVDKKWIPATSAEITLDARQNSELLSELKEALDALSGLDTDTVAEMAEKLAALESAIEKLKQDTAAADAQIKTLIEQAEARLDASIEALEARVKALEDALENVDLAQIAKNKQNIETVNEMVEALEAFHDLTDPASGLSAALTDVLNRANEALTAQVEPLAQRVAALENRVGEVDVVALKATVDAIKAITDGMPTVAELNEALTDISDILQRLENAEGKIADIEAELGNINDAITKLESELAELSELVFGDETALDQLTEALTKVNAALAELETLDTATRLGAAETAINELKDQITAINTKLANVDLEQIGANKTAIGELETAVGNIQSTLTELARKDAELESAIEAAKGELNTLIGGIEARLTTAEGKIAHLEAAVKELQEQIAQGADLSEINEALAAVEARLAALEAKDLTDRVANVEASILALDAAIKKINEETLAAIKGDITTNTVNITALGTTITEIKSTLSDLASKDASLEASIGTLSNDLGKLSTDLETVKAEIETIKADIELLKQEIEDLSKIATGDTTTIERLEKAIEDVDDALARLEGLESDARLTAVEAALKTLETTVATINGKLTGIETNAAAIAALNSTVGTLQGTLTALAEDYEELKGTVDALQTNLGTLTDRITALEGRVETAEKKLTALETAVDKLNQLLEDGATITKINDALAEVQKGLKALEEMDLSTKLSKLDEAIAALNAAVEKINNEAIAQIEKDVSANTATLISLDLTVESIQTTLAKLERNGESYAASIQALNDSFDALSDRLDLIEKRLSDAELVIGTINTAIDTLKKADEKTSSMLADAIAALNKSIEDAKTLASEADSELSTMLQSKISSARSAMNSAIRSLENRLNGEIAALEADNGQLADKITALGATVDALKGAMEAADAENRAALEAMIQASEAALDASLKQVERELDDAKAALEAAIRNGDDQLGDKLNTLQDAMLAAEQVLKSADETLKSELTLKIEDADAALEAAIKQLQLDLEAAREAIESGDKALSDKLAELENALAENEKSEANKDTALAAVSSTAVVGNLALGAWLILSKFRRR